MSNDDQAVPNSLSLTFLGAPEVRYQGQPLKFRSRKVLALLIYLAVAGGSHRRDKLVPLFWPESGQQKGNITLRSSLARVKKTLLVAGEFIIAEAGTLRFDLTQSYTLDLHQLDGIWRDGTREQLEAFFTTARGEFLEGFSLSDAPEFDEWMTIQREAWHRRVEQALERLSRLQIEAGRFDQGVETAVRWTTHSPLNEAAYHRLIEAYSLAGHRTAALQAYEQCQQILHEELGVLPSTSLAQLVDRIRDQSFVVSQPKLSEPVEPVSQPSTETPFVGRAAEYQQLITAYRQIEQQPQVVALIGEAGLGKTRLSRAFLDWVTVTDMAADILQGRVYEMGGRLPYQPLIDALRFRLERENAPEDLLADVWLAELSQLLPELRDRYPDLPPAFNGDADFVRARLFEAIAQLIEALAEKRPLLLFIDDLHWADEGTLDLLHYLIGRWHTQETAVFLLMTLRREAIQAQPSLQKWLDRISHDVTTQTLPLEPLDLTSLTLLLTREEGTAVPTSATHKLSQWLFTETQGHPFFVAEMLHMLAERNLLVYHVTSERHSIDMDETITRIEAEGRLPLPPSIHELILARLRRIGERASAVLLAAAVIGRETSFDQLVQVAGLDELAGLTGLETLLNGRILLESQTTDRPYTFAHDKFREVVYGQAGEARRRIYHRRVLAILAEQGAPPGELAFHALAAQQNEQALHYSLAAGEAALATSAIHEAVKQFAQAYQLAQQQAVDSQTWQQITIGHGRTLELSHQFDDALRHYEEMAALAEQRNDQSLLLASLIARATLFATPSPLNDPAKGEAFAEQAITLAQALADRTTEAKALWVMLLVNHYALGNEEKAREYGEAALPIARELALTETLAYTLNDLNWVYIALGDFRQAQQCAQEAVSLWRDLHNIPMLIDGLNGSGVLYSLMGEFALAETAVAEGVALAESTNNVWNQIAIKANLLWVYRERGQYEEIINILQAAIELAQATMPVVAAYFQSLLTIITCDLGAVDRTTTLCDELLAQGETAPAFWQLSALAAALQARLALIQGDLPAAQQALSQSKLPVDQIGLAAATLITPLVRCELALALGDAERCLQQVAQFMDGLERTGARVSLAEAGYLKGQALLMKGDVEAAQVVLTRAVQEANAIGGQRIVWRIYLALANVAEQQNDQITMDKYRQEARTTIERVIEKIPSGVLRKSFVKSLITVIDIDE